MIPQIQFIKGVRENTLPIVKLTRSKTDKQVLQHLFLFTQKFSFLKNYLKILLQGRTYYGILKK